MKLDVEQQQNVKPNIKKCVPRFLAFIGFMMFVTMGTFIGFSIYTIPNEHVGYVEGVNGYTEPGVYIQLPWLPKPTLINVGEDTIVFDNYTTSLMNASSVFIKTCRLKYTVKDVNAYINRIKKHGKDEYKFSLQIEADNDIDRLFNTMTIEQVLKINDTMFIDNVFNNTIDVGLVDVIFITPKVV